MEVSELSAQSEELAASGQEVERAAEQVGGAIENVASGAEEQSAQISEISKNVSQLINQIETTRKKSKDMDQSSAQVIENVKIGAGVNNAVQKVDGTENVDNMISKFNGE
jgi:methyl-accepting chemotaxis protein